MKHAAPYCANKERGYGQGDEPTARPFGLAQLKKGEINGLGQVDQQCG